MTASYCIIITLITIVILVLFLSKHKKSRDKARKRFIVFNAIYGRVGRLATEEVVLHLIEAKCLPVLLIRIRGVPYERHWNLL